LFTVVWVARFNPEMTREQASAHWTDVHGPLGCALPGMIGYVQNHVTGTIGARGVVDAEPVFDGYACESSRSRAAFEAMLRTPEWQAVVDDGHVVFANDGLVGMNAVLEPRVLRDGPRSPFKVAWFARWRGGLERAQASDYWRDVHGRLALAVPGIDRYVQNPVVASIEGGEISERRAAFDGFSECWFASRSAYERALATPEWERLVADGPNLLDEDALEAGMSVIVEERIIIPEPASASSATESSG
jgi:uncharacterized protein (TIGR02118 family)